MDRPDIAGRVIISARAYEKVAAAAAAEALGVDRREAKARVHDDRGRIAAEITSGAGRGSESILSRADRARTHTATRLTELTGASVSDVTVHLTHLIDTHRRTS